MTRAAPLTPTPDGQAQRNAKRVEVLSRRIYGPVSRSPIIDGVILIATAISSLSLAASTGSVVPAAAVIVVGVSAAAIAGWWWLGRAADRAAFEVLVDHAVRERADWRSQTGTDVPSTVRAAEAWIMAHPVGPGRPTALTRVGRLAEARAELRNAQPATPEEALHARIFERQLDLYEGGSPASSDLLAEWQSLPASPIRDLRRWCIAALDAQVAADAGRDPWKSLTAARVDVGEVDPTASAARYARNVGVFHILAAVTLLFGTAFVAG